MLTLLAGKELFFYRTGAKPHSPENCHCTSCDIACPTCNLERGACAHHAEGIGGTCISVGSVEDGFMRIAWHQDGAASYTSCLCDGEDGEVHACEGNARLREGWKRLQPGTGRPAGRQRQADLEYQQARQQAKDAQRIAREAGEKERRARNEAMAAKIDALSSPQFTMPEE